MRALSLWQPYASLVGLGVKTIETRSWSTSYRGPLAIHATRKVPSYTEAESAWSYFDLAVYEATKHGLWDLTEAPLPTGAIVATCELVDVLPMVQYLPGATVGEAVALWTDTEGAVRATWIGHSAASDITDQLPYGDFARGRFAWALTNITPFPEPIPATGRQRLWNWEEG